MTILHTLLAFVIALSLLVLVHELGHYWAARLCNVRVLRFSLGMGKIIFSRKFGSDQTEWALSILPMGGYVKLLDARTEDVSTLPPEERKREFTGKSVWCRIAIVFAGPLANFLLAILILGGLCMYGIPEPLARLRAVPENTMAWKAGLRGGEQIMSVNGVQTPSWQDVRWRLVEAMIRERPVVFEIRSPGSISGDGKASGTVVLPVEQYYVGELGSGFMEQFGLALARPAAVIGKIVPGGAAEKAGLLEKDHIAYVNGKRLVDGLDFIRQTRSSPGIPLLLGIVRNGEEIERTVIPEVHDENGVAIGRIQAEVPINPEMVTIRYGFFPAVFMGMTKAWETSSMTLKMLGKMFTGKVSVKNITGPIAIADYAGQTARAGFIRYLHFIAFISISIGVMNLLPIPVLDGGLLLYYAVEAISGRSLPERVGEMAQRAGVVVLAILLVVALFNDVARLLG